MILSVVIPTVTGRETYLQRALRGYAERTPEADLELIVIRDEPTCGVAWQRGVAMASGDYLLLTADDLVCGEGWLPPMVETVGRGEVPVVLVVTADPTVLDEDDYPLVGNPLTANSNFFETPGGPEVYGHGHRSNQENEYPSVPFCSMEQWQQIGPMIVSQYGGDRWFGTRAKSAGFWPVVCHGSVFYHYAAIAGRVPRAHGWHHQDRINFDLNVSFPMYANGSLRPDQFHSEWESPEGRKQARDWYRAHVHGPTPYWEDPELPEEYRE